MAFKLEVRHDVRRHPAGAQLWARECHPVKHDNVEAGTAKVPGTGLPGGPTAYDNGVDHVHFILLLIRAA